jgi:Ni/Co efflux regulator RcnB
MKKLLIALLAVVGVLGTSVANADSMTQHHHDMHHHHEMHRHHHHKHF